MRPVLLSLFVLAACGAPSTMDGSVDAGAPDSGTGGGAGDAGSPDSGMAVVTTLRVRYPAGTRAVFVRGSKPPFSWDTGLPMQKVDDTTWTLSVSTLAASLEWKPLLDDQVWSKGPNYSAAPGTAVEIFPRFFRDAGEWSRRWPAFQSTALNNTRGVWLYLPPTYLENTVVRLPVLYMHDGQNLFDPAAAFGGNTWKVPETMNAAASDGSIAEVIVVGPENTTDRIAEYTPTADPMYGGGRGDLYLRMLVEELKPMIDRELRTKPERQFTALAGSSLGGLISAYAGLRKADTFGVIGVFSPSTWWNDRVILTLLPQAGATRPLKVYVDSGDSGPSKDDVDNTRDLAAAYRALGYVDGTTFKYVVAPGATHTESAWAARLPGALQFLLGPGR